MRSWTIWPQGGRALARSGVSPGDRVAVSAPKSVGVVASMYGMMRAGAAYVPIDPGSPAPRAARIANDCPSRRSSPTPSAAIACGPSSARGRRPGRRADRHAPGGRGRGTSGGAGRPRLHPVHVGLDREPEGRDARAIATPRRSSTGPRESSADRRGPIQSGTRRSTSTCRSSTSSPAVRGGRWTWSRRGAATSARPPPALVRRGGAHRLVLGAVGAGAVGDPGRRRGAAMLAPLRHVVFAGEVFPLPYLRRLRELVPDAASAQLYGPTETNVCTAHVVRPDDLAAARDDQVAGLGRRARGRRGSSGRCAAPSRRRRRRPSRSPGRPRRSGCRHLGRPAGRSRHTTGRCRRRPSRRGSRRCAVDRWSQGGCSAWPTSAWASASARWPAVTPVAPVAPIAPENPSGVAAPPPRHPARTPSGPGASWRTARRWPRSAQRSTAAPDPGAARAIRASTFSTLISTVIGRPRRSFNARRGRQRPRGGPKAAARRRRPDECASGQS